MVAGRPEICREGRAGKGKGRVIDTYNTPRPSISSDTATPRIGPGESPLDDTLEPFLAALNRLEKLLEDAPPVEGGGGKAA
jgi:hypothetical protein